VADDLLEALDEELRNEGIADVKLVFRLDGSSTFLDRAAAMGWIKESVDEGFPAVRYHIEEEHRNEWW
jgi:hypothetical protein